MHLYVRARKESSGGFRRPSIRRDAESQPPCEPHKEAGHLQRTPTVQPRKFNNGTRLKAYSIGQQRGAVYAAIRRKVKNKSPLKHTFRGHQLTRAGTLDTASQREVPEVRHGLRARVSVLRCRRDRGARRDCEWSGCRSVAPLGPTVCWQSQAFFPTTP